MIKQILWKQFPSRKIKPKMSIMPNLTSMMAPEVAINDSKVGVMATLAWLSVLLLDCLWSLQTKIVATNKTLAAGIYFLFVCFLFSFVLYFLTKALNFDSDSVEYHSMQSVCSSVCFGLFNGFERIGDKIVRLFTIRFCKPSQILCITFRCYTLTPRTPFTNAVSTLIPVCMWISNHMPSEMWDEITHPFLNFNGVTVEVWGWLSHFIPQFIMHVIGNPCWDSENQKRYEQGNIKVCGHRYASRIILKWK